MINDRLRAHCGQRRAVHRRKLIKVAGRPLGLKPGYDPDKLNQLVDELAGEDYLRLQTTDADFARFPGLKWHNPLPVKS